MDSIPSYGRSAGDARAVQASHVMVGTAAAERRADLSGCLSIVRVALGVARLARPGLGSCMPVTRYDGQVRDVVRLLGARQVLQGLITGAAPSRAVLAAGAAIDAAHAISMVALGVVSRRWRRAAFLDAGIAGAFAAVGVIAARGDGHRPERGSYS